jgi:3-dehydro-4-phosphotetronate decarboxylase
MHMMNTNLNTTQAREDICRIGRSLFERGYVHATAGNISVRLIDGFLITPTDACLGFLDPARLAFVDATGRQTSGDTASKTLKLHQSIYQACATQTAPPRCVIHTHSTHCVAASLMDGQARKNPTYIDGQYELLPPLTPYFVMKVGHVPLIDYHRPGAPEVGDIVAKTIAAYAKQGMTLRAVMLSRLGPNVWHESPAGAMAVLEELEETARLWLLTRGEANALSQPQLDELQKSFGAQW